MVWKRIVGTAIVTAVLVIWTLCAIISFRMSLGIPWRWRIWYWIYPLLPFVLAATIWVIYRKSGATNTAE